ncbi:ER transmembrane protein [Schizosaccharomyces osmophilus]|uniref:ER transmembrane protein n=1 Tax=Schizosaccharomyces osmophilus TaxID=2545709 RepID=A0AAE9WE37_9SCHI|nr:ER transmembrane protein [Schizosaccharomyces osmophilus]WBW73551.1 ER transmembrane protein [Schizosaccharomyces osmophilus]
MAIWNAAALMGLLSVGLGAYGSHGLQKHVQDPRLLKSWSTGSTYLMFHSLAVMVISLHPKYGKSRWTAPLMVGGSTLFSGSIFALVLLPKTSSFRKYLGPVTPLGGLLMIAGWSTMLI